MTGRIAFAGSPDFAVTALRALLGAGAEVVGVVTQPDKRAGRGRKLRPPPVKVCAQRAGLPVFQPERIRGGVLRRWFEELEADLGLVVAYGRVLTGPMLSAPRLGCVNLHASLLPRWRGASPIQRAIEAGDRETGVCLMQMDAGLDTGPVLARRRVAIADHDDAGSLHDKLATAGAELLRDELRALLAGELEPVPQAEQGATYAELLRKSEGRIDWRRTARRVHDHIRAMTPWPGAFSMLGGEPWRVFESREAPAEAAGQPGEILTIDDAEVVVACGGGALRIGALQRPGKRRMTAAVGLRGARIRPGMRFGPGP